MWSSCHSLVATQPKAGTQFIDPEEMKGWVGLGLFLLQTSCSSMIREPWQGHKPGNACELSEQQGDRNWWWNVTDKVVRLLCPRPRNYCAEKQHSFQRLHPSKNILLWISTVVRKFVKLCWHLVLDATWCIENSSCAMCMPTFFTVPTAASKSEDRTGQTKPHSTYLLSCCLFANVHLFDVFFSFWIIHHFLVAAGES